MRDDKPWLWIKTQNGEIHVVHEPASEHDLTGLACWCHPQFDITGKVIIHDQTN